MKLKPINKDVHRLVHTLDTLMEGQQLTLEALATRSGISTRTLRRWRSGDTVPSIVDMDTVLSALGYYLSATEERQ